MAIMQGRGKGLAKALSLLWRTVQAEYRIQRYRLHTWLERWGISLAWPEVKRKDRLFLRCLGTALVALSGGTVFDLLRRKMAVFEQAGATRQIVVTGLLEFLVLCSTALLVWHVWKDKEDE